MALIGKKRSNNKFEELSYYLQSFDESGLITLRANTENYNVIDQYTIPPYDVEIYIAEKDGIGYYLINEPLLDQRENRILMAILDGLIYSPSNAVSNKNIDLSKLQDEVLKIAAKLGVIGDVKRNLRKFMYYITREIKYSVIQPPMSDPYIEEIELVSPNTPVSVVHSRHSEWPRLETNIVLGSELKVRRLIERLASLGGRSVSTAIPLQDFMLPEGHRVAVSYGEEISRGTTFNIRKFPEKPLTIIDLIYNYGTLSELMAVYLWIIAEAKLFTFLVGPTGSGKTTALNALLMLLNPLAKYLTIEDTPELKLPHKYWIQFYTRPSTYEGGKDISFYDLVRLSLRYRPDYIIVGEVRGKEIEWLVQAVASGHGGLTTFHGSNHVDLITRISGLLGPEMSLQFKQLISVVATIKRIESDNKKMNRKIVSIVENIGDEFKEVFRYDYDRKDFFPHDIKEINSVQLERARELLGWSKERLYTEVKNRVLLLRGLAEKGIKDYEDLAKELVKYYTSNGDSIEREKA
ncbi:type II/IV secretion system ATPase subunit [Sulfolobus tengchongensis]|uniref:Type II/IV secretion system ATPase subunit n=1 Tax=Sulfolobus tengchongensis TaxID=207809 RepID=A0AAX4L498_9CREN